MRIPAKLSTQLYSIGYATKPMQAFIEQLRFYGISALADVRSVPYSKVFHEYHQGSLKQVLEANGIRYVYLGEELGPRSKDPGHYNEDKQVQFDRLMNAELFKKGVDRLLLGLDKDFTIAICCAEKDPAVCHRSLLVGWSLLHHYQLDFSHILHSGDLLSQSLLEENLMEATGVEPDMLLSDSEAMSLAYKKQCHRYAYKIPTE